MSFTSLYESAIHMTKASSGCLKVMPSYTLECFEIILTTLELERGVNRMGLVSRSSLMGVTPSDSSMMSNLRLSRLVAIVSKEFSGFFLALLTLEQSPTGLQIDELWLQLKLDAGVLVSNLYGIPEGVLALAF